MSQFVWERNVSDMEDNEANLDKLKERLGINPREDVSPSYAYIMANLKRIPDRNLEHVREAMKASPQYKRLFENDTKK